MIEMSHQRFVRWEGKWGYAWHVIGQAHEIARRAHMKEFARVWAEIGLNAAGIPDAIQQSNWNALSKILAAVGGGST